MLRLTFLSLLTCLVFGNSSSATAQVTSPSNRIKVYLIGTFHFNSSPTDVMKGSVTDMKATKKQQELDNLTRRLAKIKADKVFVEWQQSRQPFVDSTYTLYRKNQFTLGNNEVYQVGYRLAKQLNHPRVYCVDAAGEFDYDVASKYAKAHGQEQILNSAFSGGEPDSVGRLIQARTGNAPNQLNLLFTTEKPNETILDKLYRINSDEFIRANMDAYLLTAARVGGGNNYAGADLAGEFYKRNMRIYTNLLRAVDVQRDKAIVLVIGAGHVSFLKQQLQYSSLFEVKDVLPLLKAK